jgi:hypothetical protein
MIRFPNAVRRCKLVLKPAELIAIGDQASRGLTVAPPPPSLSLPATTPRTKTLSIINMMDLASAICADPDARIEAVFEKFQNVDSGSFLS